MIEKSAMIGRMQNLLEVAENKKSILALNLLNNCQLNASNF